MCDQILCDNRFELRFIEGYARSRAELFGDDTGWKYIADRIVAHFVDQEAREANVFLEKLGIENSGQMRTNADKIEADNAKKD